MVPRPRHMARDHAPPAAHSGAVPAGHGRPEAARSISFHLGIHHPRRATVRTAPEAGQPEPVRKDWAPRRGNLRHKLARPGRLVHYIELRKLLIEYGDLLAKDIDYNR